mgnify:FL=1
MTVPRMPESERRQMDHLSVSDKNYDKKYNDMQERLDKLYDEIMDYEISNLSEFPTGSKRRKSSGSSLHCVTCSDFSIPVGRYHKYF